MTQKYGVKKKCAQVFGSLVWVSPSLFLVIRDIFRKIVAQKKDFLEKVKIFTFLESFSSEIAVVIWTFHYRLTIAIVSL